MTVVKSTIHQLNGTLSLLSVAMTRTVAQIFERQDLRNLMLEDDIRAR